MKKNIMLAILSLVLLSVFSLRKVKAEYWAYMCVDYWTKFEAVVPEDNGDIGHWICYFEGIECTPCIEITAE